jgi:hypothetical protein
MEIRQPTTLVADFCPWEGSGHARLRCSQVAARLSLSIPSVGWSVILHIPCRRAPPEASAIFFVLVLSCSDSTVHSRHTSRSLTNRSLRERPSRRGRCSCKIHACRNCVELNPARARPSDEQSVLRGSKPPNLCSCSATPRTRAPFVIPSRASSADCWEQRVAPLPSRRREGHNSGDPDSYTAHRSCSKQLPSKHSRSLQRLPCRIHIHST